MNIACTLPARNGGKQSGGCTLTMASMAVDPADDLKDCRSGAQNLSAGRMELQDTALTVQQHVCWQGRAAGSRTCTEHVSVDSSTVCKLLRCSPQHLTKDDGYRPWYECACWALYLNYLAGHCLHGCRLSRTLPAACL